MADVNQNQLIADLARDLVAKVAPEELPLFRANSAAYFKDPEKALKGEAGKDDMLGFGLGEVAAFVTPVVLAVLTEVVKHIGKQVMQAVEEEGSILAVTGVKRLFKKFHSTEKDDKQKLPELTAEQVAGLRHLAFEKACELKLPEDQATHLADSLAGSLAIAS